MPKLHDTAVEYVNTFPLIRWRCKLRLFLLHTLTTMQCPTSSIDSLDWARARVKQQQKKNLKNICRTFYLTCGNKYSQKSHALCVFLLSLCMHALFCFCDALFFRRTSCCVSYLSLSLRACLRVYLKYKNIILIIKCELRLYSKQYDAMYLCEEHAPTSYSCLSDAQKETNCKLMIVWVHLTHVLCTPRVFSSFIP